MSKIIHRSIFRELMGSFLLSFFVLNFVLVIENLVRIIKMLSYLGIDPSGMLRIFIYMQPMFSLLATPMALFISILLVYGRLNADNELTVLKAAGMPFSQIARPALALGLLCFGASLLFSFSVAPYGAKKLRQEIMNIISQRAPYSIREGVFNTMFGSIVVFTQDKPTPDKMSGVFLYDQRIENKPTAIYAAEATVSGTDGQQVVMDLRDGHMNIQRDDKSTDIRFARYQFSIPMPIKTGTTSHAEYTPQRLLSEAASSADETERTILFLEFHKRLSFPALCLVLMLIGPPMAMRSGKAGKLGGLALGLLVIGSYYGTLVYCEGLVRTGIFPHYFGAWIPAFIFGAGATFIFVREGRK